MIKEYIEAKYGFKVHTAYIAEVKWDLGLLMYDVSNAVGALKQPKKYQQWRKLKYFEVIRMDSHIIKSRFGFDK